jgi:hypothetical protein
MDAPPWGKKKHSTRNDAQKHLAQILRHGLDKKPHPDMHLHVYFCPKCGYWHSGHTWPQPSKETPP